MPNEITIIPFYDQKLVAVEKDGQKYVALKSICENIGIDWEGQRQRIERDTILSDATCIIKVPQKNPSGSGFINQDTTFLPIEYLNGWLFGIDDKRVKTEIQPKVILYKKECYRVLAGYFINGYSINQNRLENDEQSREKLIKELQEMRYRNQLQYRQKVQESISKICFDYTEYKEKDPKRLGQIFSTIQDMFHIASSGKTSAELVLENADSQKPLAGMVSFRGRDKDVNYDAIKIGRNYMDETAYRKMDVAIESFHLFLESRLLNEQKIFVSELEFHLQNLVRTLGFNPFGGYTAPLRAKADKKAKEVAKEFKAIQNRLESKSEPTKKLKSPKN